MNLYTDSYYIQRIQAGETDCFACLLDKYSRQVYSLVYRIVENREDAEELSQDVFMKAFRSLSSFKGESSFSTWLYKITYNTAVSATRKKKTEWLAIDDSAMENVPEESTDSFFGQVDEKEQLDYLNKALEQLPPDERGLITLFYMKEKSVEEIVSITGLSASNVKTKMYRIRKKLYALMKAMEE
ncbi:RNA polymerase sigma factor [Parabacteroides sp. Marseille-P3160]|uniref:RNA polymerase sigma factor n=1 Tax=Parabacteroides sp. Marseille-P3160 TaxID=1917887 RepID=UPI0009BA430C|nr:RNA polymerase sigma factor [Parabacteroides sp. Marseille-P3160]